MLEPSYRLNSYYIVLPIELLKLSKSLFHNTSRSDKFVCTLYEWLLWWDFNQVPGLCTREQIGKSSCLSYIGASFLGEVQSHVNWMYSLSVGGNIHSLIFSSSAPIPSICSKLNGVAPRILWYLLQSTPDVFLNGFWVHFSGRDADNRNLVVKPDSILARCYYLDDPSAWWFQYIFCGLNWAKWQRLRIEESLPPEDGSTFGLWMELIEQPSPNVSCVDVSLIESPFLNCHDIRNFGRELSFDCYWEKLLWEYRSMSKKNGNNARIDELWKNYTNKRVRVSDSTATEEGGVCLVRVESCFRNCP